MGVAAGDYDSDGDFDFFVTHFSEDYYTLYRSEGGRLFTDVSHAVGVGEVSMPFVGWGTGFSIATTTAIWIYSPPMATSIRFWTTTMWARGTPSAIFSLTTTVAAPSSKSVPKLAAA